MRLNIFHWKMSAVSDRVAVDRLRKDLIAAAQSHKDFPISEIVNLLPLKTDQTDDMIARGMIKFSGNKFSNTAQDDLWVEFQDPVLRKFSATVPANWTGTFKISGETLEVTFDK